MRPLWVVPPLSVCAVTAPCFYVWLCVGAHRRVRPSLVVGGGARLWVCARCHQQQSVAVGVVARAVQGPCPPRRGFRCVMRWSNPWQRHWLPVYFCVCVGAFVCLCFVYIRAVRAFVSVCAWSHSVPVIVFVSILCSRFRPRPLPVCPAHSRPLQSVECAWAGTSPRGPLQSPQRLAINIHPAAARLPRAGTLPRRHAPLLLDCTCPSATTAPDAALAAPNVGNGMGGPLCVPLRPPPFPALGAAGLAGPLPVRAALAPPPPTLPCTPPSSASLASRPRHAHHSRVARTPPPRPHPTV